LDEAQTSLTNQYLPRITAASFGAGCTPETPASHALSVATHHEKKVSPAGKKRPKKNKELPPLNNTMDALRDAISNVSLYEVKAVVRKAQNGLLAPPFYLSTARRRRAVALTSRVFGVHLSPLDGLANGRQWL
jgi:hypothetical protein